MTERTWPNGFDAATTNDYDRILSVVVRARMKVERTDRSVNGGAPLFSDYEARITRGIWFLSGIGSCAGRVRNFVCKA